MEKVAGEPSRFQLFSKIFKIPSIDNASTDTIEKRKDI